MSVTLQAIRTQGSATAERAGERPQGHHVVQFYERDHDLCATVARFAAAGMALGEPAILVMTPGHAASTRALLHDAGFDVDRLLAARRLTLLDAAETLAGAMDGGVPVRERFIPMFGGVVAEVRAKTGAERVRVFGEMVDLLCRAGDAEAALRLEAIGNELAQNGPFSILCGYAKTGFANAHDFDAVCGAHDRLHDEKHAALDAPEQVREVTRLHDRARVLEFEVARRVEVERRLREENRRTTQLHAIVVALSRAIDAEDAAEIVRRTISPAVGATAAGLVLLTPDGRSIERVVSEGGSQETVPRHLPSLAEDAPAFEAARTGEIVWVTGADEIDRRYPRLTELRRLTHAQAWGGVPLIFEGRPIGAIGLRFNQPRSLDPEEQSFLLVIGRQCAQALERCRLLTALQQNVQWLRNIQDVTSGLSRAKTPAEVAAVTVRHGAQAASAEACEVWLRQADGSLRMLDGAGAPAGGLEVVTLSPSGCATLAERILETGMAEFVESGDEVRRSATGPTAPSRQRNARGAHAALPLSVGGQRRGVVCFRYPSDHRFSAGEKELLLTLARQCEQALERAELYVSEADARRHAEALRDGAEAANRAKDEFLAMLGHELRNPLAPIVTALQLMDLKGHGAAAKEHEIIARQANHLVRLVDDLLDILAYHARQGAARQASSGAACRGRARHRDREPALRAPWPQPGHRPAA